MKKIFLLCLVLFACNEEQRKEMAPTTAEMVDRVQYVKDHRANLCFTVSYVHEYPFGTATIFNNVPCTPEVEKLIK